MPAFSVPNNDPFDFAIFANSSGEALRATSSHPAKAAIVGDATGGGAAFFGVGRRGGAAFVGFAEDDGAGAYVEAKGTGHGLHAKVNNPNGPGWALYADHSGADDLKRAAFFDGNVVVTGDVSFPGADCAEEFMVDPGEGIGAAPGTLMAIGPDSRLTVACRPYDRCVAGVVAGAGDLRPGIVMGRGLCDPAAARAIALVGRVWCKADATFGAIAAGDLLTSSATPGHAMRATDRERAFGAVIGKALSPLAEGRGLIQILVALQ